MAKRLKYAITVIGSFVLILSAVICAFGAVISAFSFEIDFRILLFILVMIALVFSIVATIWRGKGLLVLVLPVLMLIIWKLPEITEGAKWAAHFISGEFNKWLIVPILFPDAKKSAYELTLFFTGAGIILAYVLTAAICLRHSAFLTVFLTVPFVFLTFILVHYQPDYRYLAGLLAVYLTLLISGALHSEDFQKRGLAIFPSLAFALLLLGLTYLIASPEGYRREIGMDTIDSQLRNAASRLGLTQIKHGIGWPPMFFGEWRFDTNNVEISDAGTRVVTDQVILEITASEAGTFYLKGYSMQFFDGGRWTVNSDTLPFSDEWLGMSFPYWIAYNYLLQYSNDAMTGIKQVSMNIKNIRDATINTVYIPYYSPSRSLNITPQPTYGQRPPPYSSYYLPDNQKQITFLYTEESILKIPGIPSYGDNNTEALINYGREIRETYTQIEDDTAEGLRRLASDAGIDAVAAREVVVDKVAEYIRSSGRYTLSPYVIPEGEDFTLYFLQESRQGYCIHFATAATLMLRALDIPARFTIGFFVTVPEGNIGKPCPVTDRYAHAWVEVFYDEAGWLPLEVTPAAIGSEIPGGIPHTPDDSTAPDNVEGTTNMNMAADKDWAERPFLGSEDGTGTDQGADKGADDTEQIKTAWDIILLVFFSCAAVCFVSLSLYRPIARIYRKKRFTQKDTNAAVTYAWRYIIRLSGKKEVPEEIEELAYKARFSQHIISEDERGGMISYAYTLAAETYYFSNTFGRIWMYIRGL